VSAIGEMIEGTFRAKGLSASLARFWRMINAEKPVAHGAWDLGVSYPVRLWIGDDRRFWVERLGSLTT
jgi:hypothetical protein